MIKKVKIWDTPIRLFHWTLVAAVFFMWYSADQGGTWMVWHLRVGVLIAALLIFRLIWGFMGSQTARFSQFVKGPAAIKAYLAGKVTEHDAPGHNPLGALSVLALLGALGLQVLTGLFASDGNSYIYHGFWQHWIGNALGDKMRLFHVTFFWLLLTLIILHIVAVVFYKVVKKHNLIHPMLHGYKAMTEPVPVLYFVSSLKALVVFLAALALMYGLTQWL